MAETLHEQISAALQTRLEEITCDGGETTWYSPDMVYRVLEFSAADLDDSQTHLLFLRPDNDIVREGATSRVEGEATFTILIAKKDARSSKSPIAEAVDDEPIAATVIGRCVGDVRAALLSEVTLGGLAWNVADGEISADYSFPVEQWLCATVSFTVLYDYAA